jgi:hypothetical protein
MVALKLIGVFSTRSEVSSVIQFIRDLTFFPRSKSLKNITIPTCS